MNKNDPHIFKAALVTAAMLLTTTASASKPNILVIVADDLGYADLSFLPQSPKDVSTPGIDRIAKLGTYFSDAYALSLIHI